MFAARNDPVKGGDILLNAVDIVLSTIPSTEFQLFGYIPSQGQRIPQNVKIFPFVAKEELRRYYQEADLCVVPSLWDNSPNTVYEAMAAGKAVVASNVGGIPELIIDGETGILVEPSDPVELAEAIIEMLNNPDRCIEMGRCGRKRIVDIAELSANVEKRLQIYQSLLNDSVRLND